jgi:hypothetical protein
MGKPLTSANAKEIGEKAGKAAKSLGVAENSKEFALWLGELNLAKTYKHVFAQVHMLAYTVDRNWHDWFVSRFV